MDGAPRLLGREAEERQLGALLTAARNGRGGSLLVLGEPGIGKTTLLGSTSNRGMRELPGDRLRGRVDDPVRRPPPAHAPAATARRVALGLPPTGAAGRVRDRARPAAGPLPRRDGRARPRRRRDRLDAAGLHGRRRPPPRRRVPGGAGLRRPPARSRVGRTGVRGPRRTAPDRAGWPASPSSTCPAWSRMPRPASCSRRCPSPSTRPQPRRSPRPPGATRWPCSTWPASWMRGG